MYKISLAIVFCIYINIGVSAQKKINIPFKTVGFSSDGFTANIQKIIEDKNNFFWISTQDALCKFNGVDVLRFSNQMVNKRNLFGSNCVGMEYDGKNSLYVLSVHKGLNIININTNEVEEKIDLDKIIGNNELFYYKTMVKLANHLLILTNTKKIIYYNTDLKAIEKSGSLPIQNDLDIRSVVIYQDFIVMVLSDNSIFFFDAKNIELRKKFIGSSKKDIGAVYNSQIIDDKIWLATETGIVCFNLSNGEKVDIEKELPGFPSGYLNMPTTGLQLYDSNLIFSNAKSFFKYNYATKKTDIFISNKGEEQENFLKSATAIYNDKQQLLIGGPFGMAQLNSNSFLFSPFYQTSSNHPEKISQAFALVPINQQNILVAGDDGLFKVNIEINVITKLISNQFVHSILKISNDYALISSNKNLLIYNHSQLIKASIIYPELKKLDKDFFCSMDQLNDNKILFVSNLIEGIYLWDRKTHIVEKIDSKTDSALKGVYLNRAWVNKDGHVYLLSQTSIQSVDYVHKHIKTVFDARYLTNGKPDALMDICSQKDNYWLAAYGVGLIKLNSEFKVEKILTAKDGIPNIAMYKIFNVRDSLIVATTNSGLIVYNTLRNKIKIFYDEDGLQSSSFNYRSGYRQGDILYIGGIKGFTIFNTKLYKTNNEPPKLYFNTISYETPNGISDTTNLFIKKLEIPNNVTQTKITFIGLNYLNPKRVQYWYRIKGLVDNWADLGTRNFIPLIGINPSKYTLEIKAANEDGVECKPISMELYFLPKWYQTLFFKIAVGLAIAILLYILYSFRIKQLKKVMSIRQKIATDLHDDIGGTLSGIRILTNLAIEQNPKDYLKQIKDGITDATSAVRDTIWIMDRTRNNAVQLVEKIKLFVLPLANASNIIVDIQVEEGLENVQLGPDERRDLYLIAKEFTNNSLKHSGCKKIIFQIVKYSKKINLTMLDDGNGFDLNSVQRGNGINNICNRAENIGYQATFSSSVGGGTILQIIPKNKSFLNGLYQNRHLLRFGKTCKDLFTKKLVRKN